MYLAKPTIGKVIKKQFIYKLKANLEVYATLVGVQLFALLLSFNAVAGSGGGNNFINIRTNYYSVDLVIIFTMFWAFITAIILTTKTSRNEDFNFVTTRMISNLSNGCFLLTASIVGGVTAMLTTFMQKIILFFIGGDIFLLPENVTSYMLEVFMGSGVAILHVLLLSMLGYFIGTLVQLNKIFAVVLPIVFFGLLFTGGQNGPPLVLTQIFQFFFSETSLVLFVLKAILSAALLLNLSIYLSNRLEVRL
ncbi:hypothetical protein [Evansella tamaricis]